MKQTILIVGIIAAGILVIVLLLNYSPDLLSYDFNDSDYSTVTKQQIPELKLSLVTSEPSFWDKVNSLNTTETTAPPDRTTESLTDENGDLISQVTDKDASDDNSKNNITNGEINTPVTTVPD